MNAALICIREEGYLIEMMLRDLEDAKINLFNENAIFTPKFHIFL